MGQAAAVIDLEEVRRKREESRKDAVEAPRPVVYPPMVICWVPVTYWPVG